MTAPTTRTIRVRQAPEPDDTVEVIIAPTGVDLGGWMFAVGSLGRAVARRKLKSTHGRDWNRFTGLADHAVELAPGDPRLPDRLPDGRPWPSSAGGLLARMRFVPETLDGKAALTAARTAVPGAWTLGFRALAEHRRRDGLRVIDDLDLTSCWPSNLNRPITPPTEIKALPGFEIKSAMVAPSARAALGGALAAAGVDADVVVRCSVCDRPRGILPGGLRPGQAFVCDYCVDSARLDDLALDDPVSAEQAYDEAIGDEQRMELDGDGELHPLSSAELRRRRGWQP